MEDSNRRAYRNSQRPREEIMHGIPRTNSNSIYRSSAPPPPPEFYPRPNSNSIYRSNRPPPPPEFYPRPISNSIYRGGPPPPAEFYPRPNSNSIYRGGPISPDEFYPRPNRIRKTSSGDFSAEANEVSKRALTEKIPVAQGGNGRAINGRSNLSTSFEKPEWPNSREISRPMDQPPLRSNFEPRTNIISNSSTGTPCPRLRPPQLVNDKKPVNWPLACSMAHEYLTRGTLLGKPWPSLPQDSNIGPPANDSKSKSTSGTEEERPESSREKELQDSNTGPPGNDNKSKPTSGTEEERPESRRETEPQDSNTGPRGNVNWPLACFMAHEYLTRGTLQGKPWPLQPQDSNTRPPEDGNKSKPTPGTEEEKPETRREKKPRDSNTRRSAGFEHH